MSTTDAREAETLLAAASQCSDRALKVVYAAEARMLIVRERERLRQQEILLDAIEAEIVRASKAAST